MLIRLYDREGSKQDELAAMLYLDKAVVTRTINLLVDKGFIVRQADTEDKRVRRIYMTEYGREQYVYLRNIIQGWIDYLVKDMDPAEVKGMFEGFHKLVDRACEADLVELAKHVPQGGERREKL
jgi:DNA-binding MarR family transcriptional regulator